MKLRNESFFRILVPIALLLMCPPIHSNLLINEKLESNIGNLKKKDYLDLLEHSIRKGHSTRKLHKLASVSSTSVSTLPSTNNSHLSPDSQTQSYTDPENVNGVGNRVHRVDDSDEIMDVLRQSSGFGTSTEASVEKINKVDFYLKLKGLAHCLARFLARFNFRKSELDFQVFEVDLQ